VLDLDRLVLGRDARLSGSLRVTTLDVIATQHSDILASFCRRYPEICLETVVSNTPQSLTKREADIAIRVTNSPPQHLVGKRLGRLEFGPYAATSLIESRDDPSDLESYPWMAWDEKLNARMTEHWLKTHVPRAHISVRVDSSAANLSLLEAGAGAAFAPCLWADASAHLQRLQGPEPGFGMDLWMLTHPDLRHTGRVRAFIDHMDQAMLPLRPLMSGGLEDS
jgi:DNA-binding transcriptional LysR family regulator